MTDPFDDFDDEDRDGDPFESLSPVDTEVTDESGRSDAGDGSDADIADTEPTDTEATGPDPFEYLDDTAPGVPDVTVDDESEPLGDVDVSRGDPFESVDSPFQQVDTADIDPDEAWERVTDDTTTDPDVEPPEDDVVVVSKHQFCEGCRHFTPPPEVNCTHDGTAILEFVGPDDVRVENCPIVREQRELGEVYE